MQRLTELPREVALSTLGQVSTPGLYSNLHLCPSSSYSGSEKQKKKKESQGVEFQDLLGKAV